MDGLPPDVLVQVAGHTSLRGLVLLSSCSRDLRNLLESPAVWSLRCEMGEPLVFSAFVYLGQRGVLERARVLELHHNYDMWYDWYKQPPLPPESLAALRVLKLEKYLRDNELMYAFRTVPRERLERLQFHLAFQDSIFIRYLLLPPYPNLTHLDLRLDSFTSSHATVVTTSCPNLRWFKLHVTTEKQLWWREVAAAAAPFSRLETLMFRGLVAVAGLFRDATALSRLHLISRAGANELFDWAEQLKTESVTDLHVPRVSSNEAYTALSDLLAKWHESLRSVLLPKRFVEEGMLLKFLERYEGRLRLERLYYVYDDDDDESDKAIVQRHLLLLNRCATLKEILSAPKHFCTDNPDLKF